MQWGLDGYTPEEIRSLADDRKGKDRNALLAAADRLQGEKAVITQDKYGIQPRTYTDWMTRAKSLLPPKK